MLTGFLFLMQVAASSGAQPPLVVRMGDRVQSIAITAHPEGGRAVQAVALAAALGGQVVGGRGASDKYRFEVGTTGIDLEAGSRYAIVAGDTVLLTGRVYKSGTVVFVPLTMAVDLLPRLGAGVLYDADKHELRRFVPVVASSRAAPSAPARAESASQNSSNKSGSSANSSTAATLATGAPSGATAGARKHVVIVDAGHGGPDNGMSGPIGAPQKIYEKNVTLAISKQLARALEQRGVKVVMTRTTDTLIALRDRGRIANQAKGDVFVSVHVNAANPGWNNPGGARGFETYFLAEAKTEDERRVAAMENESIRFETTIDASRDDPLGFIIRDMAQNEHLRESSRLATLIQGGLKEVHPGTNRGVKQAGFAVLVTAFMPAVLVEVGFGSNRSDAAFMTDPKGQEQLASSIADAVVKYLAEYERKVGGQ